MVPNAPSDGEAFPSSITFHQRAPNGGRLVFVSVFVDEALSSRKLDRVRVLKNAVSVHDSGTGLALGNNAQYVALLFDVVGAILSTDNLTIELTGDAGAGDFNANGILAVF